jgi:hypothetical protein
MEGFNIGTLLGISGGFSTFFFYEHIYENK